MASLNRPGGNATYVVNCNRKMVPKRLEVLRELVGPATKVAYLMNADLTNPWPRRKETDRGWEEHRQPAHESTLTVADEAILLSWD